MVWICSSFMSTKCYLISLCAFLLLLLNAFEGLSKFVVMMLHPNFVMQYNKYIYHMRNAVQVFGNKHIHTLLALALLSTHTHINIVWPLCWALVFFYLHLHFWIHIPRGRICVNYSSNLVNLANTLNHGVLLFCTNLTRNSNPYTEVESSVWSTTLQYFWQILWNCCCCVFFLFFYSLCSRRSIFLFCLAVSTLRVLRKLT